MDIQFMDIGEVNKMYSLLKPELLQLLLDIVIVAERYQPKHK